MCRGLLRLTFSIFLLGSSVSFAGESSDEIRLRGFAEHQIENKQYGKAREAGEMGWLEEGEQWDENRRKAASQYTKEKKAGAMPDDGPLAKEDDALKREEKKLREKEREDYAREKAKDKKDIRNMAGLPTESQELGLDQERPRYDYRKRAMFGAKPKYGSSASSAPSTPSASRPAPSFGRGSLPPPPTFDDIGGTENGYVPAPNMEDFGDIPPPPPPPPPMYEGGAPDFGGGTGGGDFIPPPPTSFPEDNDF